MNKYKNKILKIIIVSIIIISIIGWINLIMGKQDSGTKIASYHANISTFNATITYESVNLDPNGGYLGSSRTIQVGSNGEIKDNNENTIANVVDKTPGRELPIPYYTDHIFKGYYAGTTQIINEQGKVAISSEMLKNYYSYMTSQGLSAEWIPIQSLKTMHLNDNDGMQETKDLSAYNGKLYVTFSGWTVLIEKQADGFGYLPSDVIPNRKGHTFLGYTLDGWGKPIDSQGKFDYDSMISHIDTSSSGTWAGKSMNAQWELLENARDISENQDGSIVAVLSEDKILSVSGSGKMKKFESQLDWDIPNIEKVIVEEGIENIGAYVFADLYELHTVELPNTIKTIGYRAFYNCKKLKNIQIPQSVTSIQYHAFKNCTSLETIVIPNGVTVITDGMFSNCTDLKSVTIPNTVTSLLSGAFEGCESITNIVIPDRVTTMENSVFQGCSNLTSVTIPSSVTTIGNEVFKDCNENLIIKCDKNSVAETYAKDNNINYAPIKTEDDSNNPGGGDNTGDGNKPGTGDNTGDGNNPGSGDNTGNGNKPGSGDNTGDGNNPGSGDNTGDGNNPGSGDNTGDGNNPGSGDNTGDGNNQGSGDNTGNDSNSGSGNNTGNGNNQGEEQKPSGGTSGTGKEEETKFPQNNTQSNNDKKNQTVNGNTNYSVSKGSVVGNQDKTLINATLPKTGHPEILLIGISILIGVAIVCYRRMKKF